MQSRTALTHLRPLSIARRASHSASSERWTARAVRDSSKKEALLKGYKSRAALKLIDMNDKHKLFSAGMTVIDLGYAPGSWMQVAVEKIAPGGRILGVDIIPAQPPRGGSTIQGNFTCPGVQASIRQFLSDPTRGRLRQAQIFRDGSAAEQDLQEASRGYIERERMLGGGGGGGGGDTRSDGRRSVDVVMSDMSEPWPIVEGLWKASLSAPYRMMNTSGIRVRDHAGSIDLCNAALLFCVDVLKPGGSFVCKFYQGPEDRLLRDRLEAVFEKVIQDKPVASRPESRENYFVALKKKARVEKAEIERMPWTKEEEEVEEMVESDAEGSELEDIDEEVDSSGYPDRYGG